MAITGGPQPYGNFFDSPQLEEEDILKKEVSPVVSPINPVSNLMSGPLSDYGNSGFAMPAPNMGPDIPQQEISIMKQQVDASEQNAINSSGDFNKYMQAASGLLGQAGGIALDIARKANQKRKEYGPMEYYGAMPGSRL